jgi:hypothetical protein
MLLVPTIAMPLAVHAATTADLNNSLCGGTNLVFSSTPGAGGGCTTLSTTAESKVNSIIALIINIFSVIVGIIAVIMIIIGGFRYITSGGNDQNVASAKNTILYAIIGLVIVALAQLIVRYVLGRVTTA